MPTRREVLVFMGCSLASVALQFPDLAAKQLEDGVKKLGLRGVAIGGSVNGEELSDAKSHPFWAKAEQLGVLVFMHPQGTPELKSRLRGNGGLENTIGNPLETTLALSHLIFEGTLDRFPSVDHILATQGLSDAERVAILGGTAAKLLGLN